ncbi:hypothetical protein EVAR_7882_1 [Eumeta japonica]|uniref:Uncharacterized protein n=1 Tax=Eumeta variegata TaxID=151549 RepID=A0A4C1TV49_EUMVA|nr:hypothetical protein EVAR_7882_1 [Eumeta japonica]
MLVIFLFNQQLRHALLQPFYFKQRPHYHDHHHRITDAMTTSAADGLTCPQMRARCDSISLELKPGAAGAVSRRAVLAADAQLRPRRGRADSVRGLPARVGGAASSGGCSAAASKMWASISTCNMSTEPFLSSCYVLDAVDRFAALKLSSIDDSCLFCSLYIPAVHKRGAGAGVPRQPRAVILRRAVTSRARNRRAPPPADSGSEVCNKVKRRYRPQNVLSLDDLKNKREAISPALVGGRASAVIAWPGRYLLTRRATTHAGSVRKC